MGPQGELRPGPPTHTGRCRARGLQCRSPRCPRRCSARPSLGSSRLALPTCRSRFSRCRLCWTVTPAQRPHVAAGGLPHETRGARRGGGQHSRRPWPLTRTGKKCLEGRRGESPSILQGPVREHPLPLTTALGPPSGWRRWKPAADTLPTFQGQTLRNAGHPRRREDLAPGEPGLLVRWGRGGQGGGSRRGFTQGQSGGCREDRRGGLT